jgi:O-antigen/teichoic acid export membrane protein
MAALIYGLCALTSIICCVLLWRSWRASGAGLLFWSALCFGCLSINNVFLVLDRVVWPVEVDLTWWRLGWALAAVVLLLFGLIWEED